MRALLILVAVSTALNFQLFAQETITVNATGVGATAQAAEKAALTNAVQQAVGLFLDSETLVKNEQVIYDRILSLSDGYVTKYDVTTPPRKRPLDGLFETTISAVVQKAKIGEELKRQKLVQTVDSKDAWAEAVTTVKSSQDAIDVLTRMVPDMVTGLMRARFIGGKNHEAGDVRPEVKPDPSTGHAWCGWNVEVGYDRNAYYERIVPLLQKAFNVLAERPSDDGFCKNPAAPYRGELRHLAILGDPVRVPSYSSFKFSKINVNEEFLVCLNYSADSSRQNLRYHAWLLNRKLYGQWLKDLFTPLQLKVDFTDEHGEVVVNDMIPLSSTLLAPSPGDQGKTQGVMGPKASSVPIGKASLAHWGTTTMTENGGVESVWIFPDFEADYYPELFNSLVIHYELSLDPDDIKKIKSAQFSFVPT